MKLRNLVEELGRRLNTALALDEGGLARIIVDQTLPVDFELDEPHGALLVYAVIGILSPGAAREAFFEKVLAANLFGSQLAPCSPAFDTERNEILLWFSLNESAHVDDAVSALEALVAYAEQWRNELSRTLTGDAGAESVAPASGSFEAYMRA